MIPVSQPDLGALERRYLIDAFDSGWISSRGRYINEAEHALSDRVGVTYAAVTSNGTTALHLALLAAGVGPGDEVILPSLTYIATLNAVIYVGAIPIVVDVDPGTWCIDPDAVLARITTRTAAIIGVDLYGHPADYPALVSAIAGREIVLVADAAESIGATLDGLPSGSLADITTFSFFGNKVITSGEGGAVTTASLAMHERILQLRNQGNHPSIRYRHEIVGYNYRMTNLSAAVLTAQLQRLDEIVAARRRVIDHYKELLTNIEGLLPQVVSANAVASPWMYSLRILGATAAQRDAVIARMSERGIETRPIFAPVQHMEFVPQELRTSTPVADIVGREGISLPTYPALQTDEIEHIVREFLSSVDQVLGSA